MRVTLAAAQRRSQDLARALANIEAVCTKEMALTGISEKLQISASHDGLAISDETIDGWELDAARRALALIKDAATRACSACSPSDAGRPMSTSHR